MGELGVEPALLRAAADGIDEVIDELKALGIDALAAEGRGFGLLAMSTLDLGSESLRDVFDGFADRWGWGVRSLVREANGIAERLQLNAGNYRAADEYAADVLKRVAVAAVGDPHTTDISVGSPPESLDDAMRKAKEGLSGAVSQIIEDAGSSPIVPATGGR